MAPFSKAACLVVLLQPLSSHTSDPGDVAKWITGTIALASGLFSVKTCNSKNKSCKRETELEKEAQRCCALSKSLVEAASGTFIELSAYESIPKKEQIDNLAQEGQRLMSAITDQELQKPTTLEERMKLVSSVDQYVRKYIRRKEKNTYQTEPDHEILCDIFVLQEDYTSFADQIAHQNTARRRKLIGSSLLFIAATGTTTWLFLGSS